VPESRIHNVPPNPPLIAIDARLVYGSSTGDSTYWTSLVQQFRREPGEFRYALISDCPAPDGWIDSKECRWIHAPARNRRLWSLLTLPLMSRRLGASAVHVQYSMSPLINRGGITTIHDVSFFIGPEWFPARDRAILRKSVPSAARRAAAVVTVSETSRREIEQFIPAARGKTTATPLGCPDWIQRVPRLEAARFVAEKFGLTEPFALSVSTRWPRKNMNLAVNAMRDVPLDLVLTGKAGWGDEAAHPRLRTVGYVDTQSLCHLYSAATMYLCPSLHEGFGIPVLEAFRCGAPVIASNLGAVPEVASDAAELLDPRDEPAWTSAISRLSADASKLDELRERGFAREREFSWDKTARATRAVYQSVIERNL
jgi:glycosyltransferase involved in cell wall biosynthesis